MIDAFMPPELYHQAREVFRNCLLDIGMELCQAQSVRENYIKSHKYCSHCGTVKEHDAFHSNRSYADGLHNKCKACVSEYNQRYREQS
jgi:hypothetical protein